MYDELLFLYVKPATTFFVTVSIQSVFPIRYEFVGGTDITLSLAGCFATRISGMESDPFLLAS